MNPDDIIAKILDLCAFADDWLDDRVSLDRDVRTLAAEIRAALDPKQEEAPWTWDGHDLRVGGKTVGSIGRDIKTDALLAQTYTGHVGEARNVPDDATARALLVAMAGFDPDVTFVLTLRPNWTREGIDDARNHGLGCYVAGLLEGYAEDYDDPQHADDPEVARRWWAGGYKALNLSVKERSDDHPF